MQPYSGVRVSMTRNTIELNVPFATNTNVNIPESRRNKPILADANRMMALIPGNLLKQL